MKLTESERKENREAFATMNLPQKLSYLFEYYKFPMVLILIVVTALGSILYYRITRKDPLLYVAFENIAMGDTMDTALNQGFIRSLGMNPAHTEVRLSRNLYLSQDASVQNHEYAYASQIKVMASMANSQLDVALMNREAYDIMSSGGYLLPLDTLLGQDAGLYERVARRLRENTVIIEDNNIEHLLDENVAYQARTEKSFNGILISEFPLFKRAGFAGEVYLGVIGNSTRTNAVLQYIDYLTKDIPDGASEPT